MALQPNQRLGPYEILSAIGAGGMGEVYRAHDTRLDRIVAIKVLPDHLASRAEPCWRSHGISEATECIAAIEKRSARVEQPKSSVGNHVQGR
jgi:serine/threonine protein kinase